MKNILKILGIVIAIPIAAFIAFSLYDAMVPKICVVYFDNGLGEAVKVKIDAGAPIDVKAHEISRQELKQGSHKIEVVDAGGAAIDGADFTYKEQVVGDKTKYVFNIKSASKYAEYTMAYGSDKVDKPKKAVPAQHLFESPAQLMELCDAFPASVPIRKGSGGALRTVLAHDPLHRAYPCCRKTWESLKSKQAK